MSNLRLLIVESQGFGIYRRDPSLDLPDSLRYLYWWGYPLEFLPPNFSPENLLELHMPNSKVKKLWKEGQILMNLEVIDLHDSEYLTEVPNLSGSLKIVRINLGGCKSLVEIPCSVGFLSLEVLDLKYSGILEIPDSLVCSTLRSLSLSGTKITSIPASIKQASRLFKLNIVCCKRLQSLPELPVLCNVKAQGCNSLKTVSNSRTALT
ncbi:unnamed protein product [Malus baccata var. baccata]